MSQELALAEPGEIAAAVDGDRTAALVRLADAADAATTHDEAHEIMLKGRILADALQQMKAPYDEAWLAGKASVVAARRLAKLLAGLQRRGPGRPGRKGGQDFSERTIAIRELGISLNEAYKLDRLAKIDDPSFQRFIQDRTRIPTLYGALVACKIEKPSTSPGGSGWRERQKKRVGAVTPANPSVDEAYSLIVKALGHLHAAKGISHPARGKAMDALYEAEDTLKPYRGGYVRT